VFDRDKFSSAPKLRNRSSATNLNYCRSRDERRAPAEASKSRIRTSRSNRSYNRIPAVLVSRSLIPGPSQFGYGRVAQPRFNYGQYEAPQRDLPATSRWSSNGRDSFVA
jgi:hypothetical protein